MQKRLCLLLCAVFMVLLAPFFGGCKNKPQARTRYEVTAEYAPEHQTVTGAVKVHFQNTTENELDTLAFQVYTNAYRENALYPPVYTTWEPLAYYDGKNYGETKVTSVNGAKGWKWSGEDENILSVTLLQSLFPNESVVLDVGFTVTLPKVNHRFGVAQNAVYLHQFFPVLCALNKEGFREVTPTAIGSPFALDSADYKIALTLPKEYAICSSCTVEATQTLESKTEYLLTGEGVRRLGLALYTKRETLQTQVDGCTLVYDYVEDETAEQTLQTMTEAFRYCQKRFGAYPYPSFTLLQSAFAGVADGYTAFAVLSQDLTAKERTACIVRETVKQWFGEAVGVDRVENAWQYDGLAEYIALTFFDSHTNYGIDRERAVAESVKEYRSYYDIYGNVLDRTDSKMTKPLQAFASEYEYQCLSVRKAVIMLDALQKSIGEKRLTAGLKGYYTKYTYANTGVGELIGAIEHQGADVQGFFDGFLQGKVIL